MEEDEPRVVLELLRVLSKKKRDQTTSHMTKELT